MADHGQWRKNIPADFDGRFGKEFDEEIQPRGIFEVGVGIAVACAVSFLIVWGIMAYYDHTVEASRPAPLPVKDATAQRLPDAPLLQAHPTIELQQMRQEMAARLHGYGWADEAAGTVHIPIDKAIDLALERGLIKGTASDAGATGPAATAPAGEEPATAPVDEPAPADTGATEAGEAGH